jgi:hypothetical protein
MKLLISELLKEEFSGLLDLIIQNKEAKFESSLSFQLAPLLLGYKEVELIFKNEMSWLKFSEVLFQGILEDLSTIGLAISFYSLETGVDTKRPEATVVVLWSEIKALIYSCPLIFLDEKTFQELEENTEKEPVKKDKIYPGKHSEETDD